MESDTIGGNGYANMEEEVERNAYQRLGAAILLQALRDYRRKDWIVALKAFEWLIYDVEPRIILGAMGLDTIEERYIRSVMNGKSIAGIGCSGGKSFRVGIKKVYDDAP